MTEPRSPEQLLLDDLAALADVVRADLAARLDRLDLPENLLEAVRYSVLDGGKRLRPTLTILSCEAVGGDREAAMPAACAIELIHCFSLVHDDLPAMDDDDLRRGRPTLHRHAGEAMAILAGDVMVSVAFEWLDQAELPGEARSMLVAELARATSAMIAGQVYDTLGGFDRSMPDVQRLLLIHRNKTEALIRCACRMGALSGGAMSGGASGADDEGLAALTSYGESIGLMFQIVDDLLDVTQTAEHIGKATGKDLPAGKLTYPGLCGIEASQKEIARLQQAALNALEGLGESARPLADICNYLAVRTR